MSENEKPKSDVTYKKITATPSSHEEIYLSAESATDKGAWELFLKLKKEMKDD